MPDLTIGFKWNTNSLSVNGSISVINLSYTLTYTAGANGSISGTSPQTVIYGTNGTAVSAVPNLGYHFVNWTDGSTANPRTDVNVTNNLAVTANFVLNPVSVVVLTSPTNGTSFNAPATINLAANVTSNGNMINAVNFFSDSTNLLAHVVTAPYFCAWTNVGAGSYSLLARVVFNGSASNDSAMVAITVSNVVAVVPVISAISLVGGDFTLGGTGGVGQTYIMMAAMDLVTPIWMPILTNVADASGRVQFTYPGATTNHLRQFYRLSSP